MLSSIITNKKKLLQALSLGLALIFLLSPLMVLGAYHLVFQNKIYPHISVTGIDLSSLTINRAEEKISKKVSQEQKPELAFEFKDKSWVFKLSDFNLVYQPEETINQAYTLGRKDGPFKNLQTKWQLWREKKDLPISISFEEDLFEEKVATISALLNKPAIPPQIKINQAQVLVEKGLSGQEINQEKLKQAFVAKIGRFDFTPLELPLEEILPEISEEMAEETKKRAEKLLGEKLSLVFKGQVWTLEEETLISFLDFQNGFDEEKIKNYLASLAENIDRPPQNALFNFQNGRVIEFKPAQDGQKLEQEKTFEAIEKNLVALEQEETEATIDLQVALTKPEITTDQVNNLGIKELIGQGVSFFYGSSVSRIENIKLASLRLNGLLLKPEESFSFNQALGEVSKETGFKEAWVIKEGKTVLGDGGGVCQVSTTLFRAVLNAGLPIEERQAHAYRVYYYEQNSPVGLDATVFEPSPDLKFKNDTANHILIQTSLDTYNQKLSFYFYGTPDGRQVFISQSRIWDQSPPPPDKYIDDPSLPSGTVKQIDFKAWGAKASFDWRVTRGSEVLQERTFYSYYRPWQAVYLRGTK